MKLFGTPLSVSIPPKKASKKPVKVPDKPVPIIKPPPPAPRVNVRYIRDERTDIDTQGYKAYFYHFKQTGEVGDKEYEELLISAATMDQAIEIFESSCFRGDCYNNSIFSVTLTGVDFNSTREEKIVMAV